MRICFLADAGSVHSRKWVSYFVEAGDEVHWISLSPFPEPCPGASCHHARPGGLGFLGVALSSPGVRRRLAHLRPDVTHVHSVGSYGFLALLAASQPLVATAWGSDVLIAPRSLVKRRIVERVLKKASLITCDAEHIKPHLERLGTDPSRVEVVNFGVDVDRFSPGPVDAVLKERLGLTSCPVVISLRHLEPIYDLATLVQAAPLVLSNIPGIQFLLFGQGSQEAALRHLAHRLGVEDRVHFLGNAPNDALPGYLRSASVYVSTALSDAGIAASTAEAMSCGLPVVVTDFGDNSSWVHEGKGGFLVPLRDPPALARKIVWLLEHPAEARNFGLYNREMILERNNYRAEMARMRDFYHSLVGGGR